MPSNVISAATLPCPNCKNTTPGQAPHNTQPTPNNMLPGTMPGWFIFLFSGN